MTSMSTSEGTVMLLAVDAMAIEDLGGWGPSKAVQEWTTSVTFECSSKFMGSCSHNMRNLGQA